MRGLRTIPGSQKRSMIPGADTPMEPGIFVSRHHEEDRLSIRVHWNDQFGEPQRKWFPAGRISDKAGRAARLAYAQARQFRQQYRMFREQGRMAMFNPDFAPYSNRVLGMLLGS